VEPKQGKEQSFYRWVDGEGRVHIVSSIGSVPEADRPRAEVVTLDGLPRTELPGIGRVTLREPEWASFAAGFGAALVLVLVYKLLPSGLRTVSRWAIVIGAGALLTAGYLGWVRRSSSAPGSAALATPAALVDDAKAAVERMNQRQADQQRALREIEAESSR
jgi:hypothetical protein